MIDEHFGGTERPYEVGLLTDTGDELLRATGMAEMPKSQSSTCLRWQKV
jgi:hypothetical protein